MRTRLVRQVIGVSRIEPVAKPLAKRTFVVAAASLESPVRWADWRDHRYNVRTRPGPIHESAFPLSPGSLILLSMRQMTLPLRGRSPGGLTFVLSLAGLVFLGLGVARAQVPDSTHRSQTRLDSLRARYRIPPAPVAPIVVASFLGAPGSTLGSPSTSGVGSGDYFVGTGFQERTRYTSLPDGGFGGGMGFGDAEAGVALEVAGSSYSSIRHAPLSIGGISVKLHHRDADRLLLYAVGVENVASWGLADGGRSVYAEIEKVLVLRPGDNASFGVLSASLGIGNGRFRTETDIDSGRKTFNAFGGVGLRLISSVALAADWTGQDLDAGFTITPFPGRGIVGTVGMADLTRRAGDGPRFIMSLGFGFNAHRDDRKLSPEDLNAIFVPR